MPVCNGKLPSNWVSRYFKRFSKKQEGVTSVEFSIVFFVFILVLLFLFETCRFISLVSTLDLSLAESGRLASRNKLNNETYLQVFNKNLHDKNKTLMWLFFGEVSADQVKMTIRYCDNITDIIDDRCNRNSNKLMAIYNVSYDYSPAFLPVPSRVFSGLEISSSAIYVQEHGLSGE